MTMRDGIGYATAEAFRRALKDRFIAIIAEDSSYSLSELQRQFAYDRVLARCFAGDDAGRWVLKGAGALLARLEHARHSKDIDLYYAMKTAAEAEATEALRDALARDVGDFFRFEVVRMLALPEAAKGRRVHVNAQLGPKAYCSFHVDVVVGTAMSGEPDLVSPLTPIEIPGLVRPPYRVFPLADHIADKLSATVERHQHGGTARPSSRVKDLVDLALIAASQEISGARLREAIRVGFAHRGLEIPLNFTIPDEKVWRSRYPRAAGDAPGPVPSYDDAVGLVRKLLDPVLSERAPGSWDPVEARWN